MQAVTSITVLYDATCGLCTFAKDWIRKQSPLVGLTFLAAGSIEARRAFPQLSPRELAVVADTGEVWFGNHAWIVCLWALRDYRDLAFWLTSPPLLLMSRGVYRCLQKPPRALQLAPPPKRAEIEQQLRNVAVARCQTEPM